MILGAYITLCHTRICESGTVSILQMGWQHVLCRGQSQSSVQKFQSQWRTGTSNWIAFNQWADALNRYNTYFVTRLALSPAIKWNWDCAVLVERFMEVLPVNLHPRQLHEWWVTILVFLLIECCSHSEMNHWRTSWRKKNQRRAECWGNFLKCLLFVTLQYLKYQMMVSIWTLLSILNFAEITYLASSPDEIALVQGARDVGVVFKVT